MKQINKNSALPFYLQIKEEIIKFAKKSDSAKALPCHEELARIFGTSRFTVAKAVSELKKEKILNAVKGRGTFLTGETPSSGNRFVIEKKKLVTFIIPTSEGSPIFQGAQLEAEKEGLQILLKNDALIENRTREEFVKRERDFLMKYRDGEFGESLILYYEGGKDNLDILKALIKEKRPLVLIDRLPDELPCDYVGYDNFNAAKMVTEEFIKMGRKNIAIVGTGKCISSAREQVAGYSAALKENGLAVKDENIILEVDFFYYSREDEIRRLKERFASIKDKVDAVYFMSAFSEDIILGEMNPAELRRDLVLAGNVVRGFQDKYVFSIEKPLLQIGEEAVRLLNARLSSGTSNRTMQVKLPVELVKL